MTNSGFHVAVVGATGAVGREMLDILETRDFPLASLRAMASSRSAGTEIPFRDSTLLVEDLDTADFSGIDFALFSAGGSISKLHGPRAAQAGAVVIDNTSAFRMDADVPLVVPEVNADAIQQHQGIIANPNCSTIQMVAVLKPLHDHFGLERVVVSTYQSASGAGQKGINELLAGSRACLDGTEEPTPSTFAHPLAFEVLPQIDVFDENGYTREELKMIFETRKILDLPDLAISATCVRVPVLRSHAEAVTVDLQSDFELTALRALLNESPGVTLLDNPAENIYPLSRQATGTDSCWVGRLRRDLHRPHTLHLWVVSDNLRKGAALNAVQIAESIMKDPQ